jgi:hypothetical protein
VSATLIDQPAAQWLLPLRTIVVEAVPKIDKSVPGPTRSPS